MISVRLRREYPWPRLAGQSFDNAVAETVHGLYKAELINRRGRWRSAEHVELRTGEWVDWWMISDHLPSGT